MENKVWWKMNESDNELSFRDNQMNGEGYLLTLARDVTIAWKIGMSGQTEMLSFCGSLPASVEAELKDKIEKIDLIMKQKEIEDIKLKYTYIHGHPSNQPVFEPTQQYYTELFLAQRNIVMEVYRLVMRALEKQKYIYQTKSNIIDRGAMSLFAPEVE